MISVNKKDSENILTLIVMMIVLGDIGICLNQLKQIIYASVIDELMEQVENVKMVLEEKTDYYAEVSSGEDLSGMTNALKDLVGGLDDVAKDIETVDKMIRDSKALVAIEMTRLSKTVGEYTPEDLAEVFAEVIE